MARDEEVRIPLTLGGREERVECVDTAPVRKEVALVVVRPGVVAEIVIVIDSFGEGEVFRYGRCCDTGFGESGDGRLTLFELGAEGAE